MADTATPGISSGQSPKGRMWWRWLIGIWLIIVAGLPIYYMQPDFDWYYPDWGEPGKILKSYRIADNPLYKDEDVYTRVFIILPAEGTLTKFHEKEDKYIIFKSDVEAELQHASLHGPYQYANDGCVNFVLCDNGLMLVYDFSRNKGGLLSSRMGDMEYVRNHFPAHSVFFYFWAILASLTLILTPCLLVIGALFLLTRRIILVLSRNLK